MKEFELVKFSCRDSLLASLLDGVRASGNRDVCVKMKPTIRGLPPFITYMYNLYLNCSHTYVMVHLCVLVCKCLYGGV